MNYGEKQGIKVCVASIARSNDAELCTIRSRRMRAHNLKMQEECLVFSLSIRMILLSTCSD